MNRFTEMFKSADYGPKNDPLTPFWPQKNFLNKSKTVTFNQFLLPVIR